MTPTSVTSSQKKSLAVWKLHEVKAGTSSISNVAQRKHPVISNSYTHEIIHPNPNPSIKDAHLIMSSEYPDPFIIHPEKHENTLVLLHGTSMTGESLADAFLNYPIPISSASQTTSPTPLTTTHTTLPLIFPTLRLVFPTGKQRTTTVFNGALTNAWFDIHAFHDRTIGEVEACVGVRESLAFLHSLLLSEISLLDQNEGAGGEGGGKGGIVIGGFSQGCAMLVMLLLSGLLESTGIKGRVKGFVGMSGWMPFRLQIQDVLSSSHSGIQDRRGVACTALHGILGTEGQEGVSASVDVPMFFTHGVEDQKVKMEWSREMTEVLRGVGAEEVEMVEMEGVGHWFGDEGMVGLVGLLRRVLAREEV
ncbi:alpha/beta-Hydrolase [Glarea lozoyensis ATCC 20868]|uniref:Alpha/beta-Hydrolase n=1 Tax=Glarea lozoyensis (strain ATCC 20868 / MF5171) TaxID=1116229 RepID=S3CNW5_GLAL2|nr:alpha/beta-Hydrolase [Glarea lozoyensis ATCC 20868]EPE27415.1 alpha/beta-Hydrolase [Glarea lozoyensis ATCC 20868]